jgi:glycosyltransferase involved in cell wall biosynthesis
MSYPNPVFTVVIPTYNGQRRIGAALDSLIIQTINPALFEVVVISDGSTDRTLEVARKKMEGREGWRALFSAEEKCGPGIARNWGVAVAKGEYIVFLDDDDTLTPDALQTLMETMAAAPTHPDLIACNFAFDTDPDDHPGRRKDLTVIRDRRTYLREYLRLKTDGSVIFTAFSAPLARLAGRFRPGVHEDVDFMFLALRREGGDPGSSDGWCFNRRSGVLHLLEDPASRTEEPSPRTDVLVPPSVPAAASKHPAVELPERTIATGDHEDVGPRYGEILSGMLPRLSPELVLGRYSHTVSIITSH